MPLAPQVKLRHNLKQLEEAVRKYIQLGRKGVEEALIRQGGNLSFILARELKKLAPKKGEIRRKLMSNLAAGKGVYVRPEIQKEVMTSKKARTDLASGQVVFGSGRGRATAKRKGKTLNLRAMMVDREIGARERAAGFLSWSAKYPRKLPPESIKVSRHGGEVSREQIKKGKEKASVSFTWDTETGRQGKNAARGMMRSKSVAAQEQAIAATVEDILEYIDRQHEKDVAATFRLLNRPILKPA